MRFGRAIALRDDIASTHQLLISSSLFAVRLVNLAVGGLMILGGIGQFFPIGL